MDRCGPRRRDIEDASAWGGQLQTQTRKTLLGRFCPPALLRSSRILHRVGLVKSEHTVEVVTHPRKQLVQARGAAFTGGAQCCISHEQNAVAHGDVLVGLPFREWLDICGRATEIRPVAQGVFNQGCGF